MFQDGCENDMFSNQLTIVILYKILVEKEPKVTMNPEIPEEQVTLDKLYYHCVYVMLFFNNEVGVYRKYYQEDV